MESNILWEHSPKHNECKNIDSSLSLSLKFMTFRLAAAAADDDDEDAADGVDDARPFVS